MRDFIIEVATFITGTSSDTLTHLRPTNSFKTWFTMDRKIRLLQSSAQNYAARVSKSANHYTHHLLETLSPFHCDSAQSNTIIFPRGLTFHRRRPHRMPKLRMVYDLQPDSEAQCHSSMIYIPFASPILLLTQNDEQLSFWIERHQTCRGSEQCVNRSSFYMILRRSVQFSYWEIFCNSDGSIIEPFTTATTWCTTIRWDCARISTVGGGGLFREISECAYHFAGVHHSCIVCVGWKEREPFEDYDMKPLSPFKTTPWTGAAQTYVYMCEIVSHRQNNNGFYK